MPHLSLSVELEAGERWSIEIDGRTYVAEQVSRPAIIRWMAAVAAAGENALKQEQALHQILRVAFPARWRYSLPWVVDPAITIENLNLKTRERVLESFFGFALPSELTAGPKTMSGPSAAASSSAARTPSGVAS